MARTKRAAQLDAPSVTEAPADPEIRPAEAPSIPTATGESPALGLRRLVEDAFSAPEERWSPRRTLLFIVLVCGAFWAAVVAALFKLA